MRAVIEAEPLAKIDYVSMVDALTMQPVEKADVYKRQQKALAQAKN